mmetsp:Transcript_23203/g.53383  ORF Transcript_23203/g.53383 Transcript_23203/m.53383 type:complete len:925 (+) Transcript_23203:82-2856(+)
MRALATVMLWCILAAFFWTADSVRPSYEAEARAQMGLAHERVNDANGILTQKVKDLSWDDDEEDEPPVLDADEEDSDVEMDDELPKLSGNAKQKAPGALVQMSMNESARREATKAYVFAQQERALALIDVEGEVSLEGKCPAPYGDFEKVEESSWIDDREGLSTHYWLAAPGAWIAQLGSLILGYRITAINSLKKEQAVEVIELMYGKVIVRLPNEQCYIAVKKLLYDMTALINKDRTIKDLKTNREAIRTVIDNAVPYGCPGSDSKTGEKRLVPGGKRAKRDLQPLKYGLWVLYKPMTSLTRKTIAASATDGWRFTHRNFPDRQMWHYGKNHLYNFLSCQIRNEMFMLKKEKKLNTWDLYKADKGLEDNLKARGEFKAFMEVEVPKMKRRIALLKDNLVRTARIMSFSLASLQHAEYEKWTEGDDGLEKKKVFGCIGFPVYHTDKTAKQFPKPDRIPGGFVGSPDLFDQYPFLNRWWKVHEHVTSRDNVEDTVTLLFRERMWRGIGKKFKVLVNPYSWLRNVKKWYDRKTDSWNRLGAWNKVMMIITPIMKIISYTGIVLGAVTFGATTITTLVVDFMVKTLGAELAVSGGSFLVWILQNAIFQATAPLQGELFARIEGRDFANEFYYWMGYIEDVQLVRHIMHSVQDEILSSDWITEHMVTVYTADPTLSSSTVNPLSPAKFLATTVSLDENGGMRDHIDADEALNQLVKSIMINSAGQEWERGIQENLGRKRDMRQRGYGWVTYKAWRGARMDVTDCSDLVQRHVALDKGSKTEPDYIDGVVQKITSKWGTSHLWIENLKSFTKEWVDVKFDDDVKKNTRVYDRDAYFLVSANWLRWKNWLWWAKKFSHKGQLELLEKKVRIHPDYMVDVSDTEQLPCFLVLKDVAGAKEIMWTNLDKGAIVKSVRRPWFSSTFKKSTSYT